MIALVSSKTVGIPKFLGLAARARIYINLKVKEDLDSGIGCACTLTYVNKNFLSSSLLACTTSTLILQFHHSYYTRARYTFATHIG